MLFFQSQQAVEADFLLPVLDQKAVRIGQKDQQYHSQKPPSDLQKYPRIGRMRQGPNQIVVNNGRKHKIGKGCKNAGHKIRIINGSIGQNPLLRHSRQNFPLLHLKPPVFPLLQPHALTAEP